MKFLSSRLVTCGSTCILSALGLRGSWRARTCSFSMGWARRILEVLIAVMFLCFCFLIRNIPSVGEENHFVMKTSLDRTGWNFRNCRYSHVLFSVLSSFWFQNAGMVLSSTLQTLVSNDQVVINKNCETCSTPQSSTSSYSENMWWFFNKMCRTMVGTIIVRYNWSEVSFDNRF